MAAAFEFANAPRAVPKYIARHAGVSLAGKLDGFDGWFVACSTTGRNCTALILDPLLPEGSRLCGATRVKEDQALRLAAIGCDPEGTSDLQDAIRDKLREAG